MQSIMLNIFNLIENFLDIINNEHYLITCAKLLSSNMNDACTIYPVTLLASCKSHMVNCILFEKENNFCMAFVLAISWLTWESAHEVHLKYNI